jgi:hypothetical protein
MMKSTKMYRKTKRILKYTVFSAMAVFVLLTLVLAVHIYQVSNMPKGGVDGWQMARIDVVSTKDSISLEMFRNAVQSQDGVFHTYVNYASGTLAFAYNPEVTHADTVCSSAKLVTGLKAERILVHAEDVANACPVIDKNSITYRISSGFQKLFQ